MPPEFKPVFTLSVILELNNDRLKYLISINYIDEDHTRVIRLELANHTQFGGDQSMFFFETSCDVVILP